jgi:hypothetical protein
MAQISYNQQAGQSNTTHRTHMDEMKHLKMTVTVFGVVTANFHNVSSFLTKICPTFRQQHELKYDKSWPNSATYSRLDSATPLLGPIWMKCNS